MLLASFFSFSSAAYKIATVSPAHYPFDSAPPHSVLFSAPATESRCFLLRVITVNVWRRSIKLRVITLTPPALSNNVNAEGRDIAAAGLRPRATHPTAVRRDCLSAGPQALTSRGTFRTPFARLRRGAGQGRAGRRACPVRKCQSVKVLESALMHLGMREGGREGDGRERE